MSDVLLGVIGGVAAAVVTQLLAARISAKQWERSEARRREEIALEDARRQEEYRRADTRYQDEIKRNETRRLEDLKAARLREFWEHVLLARVRILGYVEHLPTGIPVVAVEQTPTVSAMHACGVALLGLSGVYPLAKEFFHATADLELNIRVGDDDKMSASLKPWHKVFADLEGVVAKLSGIDLDAGNAGDDDAVGIAAASTKVN